MSDTAQVMTTHTSPQQRGLPSGWRWVLLGEVCEIIAGQSPPGSTYRASPEGLPFFQGKADFGKTNPVACVWCVEPTKIARPGDILISVRAPVGPTNVADFECCIGRGLAAIRCGKNSDRDFILNALRHFEATLVKKGSGSTFEAINRDDLESFEIPLPPLPEQQRIAGVLREQMAMVEKARAAAQARLEAVKALPAAFLRQVFPQPGQPLPDAWRWVKLGEMCDRIDYGYTASADVDVKTPKFLRITDIQNNKVSWDSVPGCAILDADEGANRLEDGDIVFARTGATTGKSYLISNPPRSVFASYLIRVKSHREHVEPDYLFTFFQSDGYWKQVSAGARGGAQPGFNATMLAALKIPLPPLSEQRLVAAVLHEQMTSVEKIRSAAEEELATINALPAALLRRAFAGEL